jgi:hypothetical protein
VAATQFEHADQARLALRTIVAEHGFEVLSQPTVLANLLADLLPESPRIARLVVAAAQDKIAEELRQHTSDGMDGQTATLLAASSLAAATMFTQDACVWVAGEFALVLGLTAEPEPDGEANPTQPNFPPSLTAQLPDPADPADPADPSTTPPNTGGVARDSGDGAGKAAAEPAPEPTQPDSSLVSTKPDPWSEPDPPSEVVPASPDTQAPDPDTDPDTDPAGPDAEAPDVQTPDPDPDADPDTDPAGPDAEAPDVQTPDLDDPVPQAGPDDPDPQIPAPDVEDPGQDGDQDEGDQDPPGEPQAPATWFAVVTADRGYFDDVVAEGDAQAASIRFPGDYAERRYQLLAPEVRIGRRSVSRGLDPEIDLAGPPTDPGVSHLHAVLVAQDDGTWAVLDPGSSNGTQVNGREIKIGVPVALHDGDRVSLGAWTTLTIHSDPPGPA